MSAYGIITMALVANERKEVSAIGSYFRILKSTGDLVVEVNGDKADFVQKGIGIPVTGGLRRLAFTSPINQTIIVGVSDERIDDNRLSVDAPITVDAITNKVSVDDVKSTALVSTVDVSLLAGAATLIKGGNSARREIIIRNLIANTVTFRIGDVTVAADRGIELEPGGSITLESTDAVYGYNDTAAAESVSILEVRD